MKKSPQPTKTPKAFSLLELSITILIIGILLIGVIGSKHLIKKTRLASAQSLTTNSPINGILDNALWLESSLDYKAFSNDSNPLTSNDSGDALADGEAIENWNDNSYNQNKPSIVSVGNGPTYANTINHVQAVKFSGSDTDYLKIEDASFLNNSDYTIFILEKRLGDEDNNYFIGDSTITDNNETLILGYSDENTPIHSQGSSNSYDATVEGYASYSNKPRLFTFISDSVDGKKMYINGVLAGENNNTDKLSNITSLAIGKGYNGEIGEIVIFTRALKNTERKDIEDYISTKWKAPNNRDVIADCSTGTVTSTGCDNSCSFSINGVSATSLASGGTETYSRGVGYTGSTPEYTCTSGVLSPTASSSDCSDNGCASGYTLISGECVIDTTCPIPSINGVTQTGSVAEGAGTLTCNGTHFDGNSINYTCASNTLTPSGTCGCATGYINSTCNSCDTANNYTDFDSNGSCELKCTITGEFGITDGTMVEAGTTSLNCNVASSEGSISYTCNNGTLGSINNECFIPACLGGTLVKDVPSAGEVMHVFTTVGSTTLVCTQSVTAKLLVVAGGGSGSGGGGGGGAGGLIYNSAYALSPATYNVTVGGPAVNSVFNNLTAIRGGTQGQTGGSGGGGGYGGGAGRAGTVGQGNAGGTCDNIANACLYAGGAGGGAGSVGGNAKTAYSGGDGGAGLYYGNIFSDSYGDSGWFASGGGARGTASGGGVGGTGSIGGGGNGRTVGGSSAEAGMANTGGGGGGNSGAGGSGIVIVRYTNP